MIRKLCVVLLLALSVCALAQQSSVIKQIDIHGNNHVTAQAIQLAMRTKVGQPYNQAQLDQDKQSVLDMGFFQAVDIRAQAPDTTGWVITVDVQEYPIIKEIRITGNHVFKTDRLMKLVESKPGEVFNVKAIGPSSKAIEGLYDKEGYAARVTEFGPLRESPSTLNIVIVERTIGQIKIVGNTKTKASVMRHLIRTRTGDPYSLKKWQSDLKRLYGTQWFETPINIKEEDSGEIGKSDYTITVKEAKTGTFGVGLQMDPRSSLAGFINLSDHNFRGTGQSIGINFLQATTGGGASVDFNYSNPFTDSHDTSMSISLYSHLIYRFAGTAFGGASTPTNDNRYTERRTGGQLGFAREVKQDVFANVGGRFERIKTSNLSTTASDSFIQQDGDVGVLTFGVTRNKRDVDLDPSRGDWIRLSVEPGFSHIMEIGGVGADTSILGSNLFAKENLELRKYWSPGQPPRLQDLDAPRRVFAFRARYGHINGKVPFFEQYFAGGSESIRGYPEDRFWGKQSLLTTLEYRHPVQKSFNIVTFVDYGDAWGGYGTVNSYTQSDKLQMHLGYGFGLSFKTPLGPIRLDLGFDNHGKSRAHFLIGTSF